MRNTYNINYPFFIFVLFGCFISLPPSFDLMPQVMSYDEKRIFEISLLILAICGIIFSKEINSRLLYVYFSLPRQSRWALIYIFCAGLLSSVLAPSTSYALMELSLFCLLFFFCLFTAAVFQKHGITLIGILLTGIYAGAFFYEVTFFTSYIGSFIQSNPLVLPEPFSGFSSIRFFNQYQIWTMPFFPLALFLYGKRLPSVLRGLAHVITVSWWILLFASQSRGAISALLIAYVATLAILGKHIWPVLKSTAYSAIIGGILYILLFVYLPESTQPAITENIFSSSGRAQLWIHALDMIQNNPWLGVGPMHFAYYPSPGAYGHPHNSFIQLAVEWGLPAALLILWLFIWGNIAWVKNFRAQTDKIGNENNLLRITLFTSFIAGSLYSLVSGVIVMPMSQMMLAVVTGLMLGLYFQESKNPQVTFRGYVVLNILATSILLLTIVVYTPHIQLRLEPQSANQQQSTSSVLGPRIWQEGGIPH